MPSPMQSLEHCNGKSSLTSVSYHSGSGLDVLKHQILCLAAAFDLELGLEVKRVHDQILLCLVNGVDVKVDVVASNLRTEVLGALPCLDRTLLRHAHVHSMKDLSAESLCCGGAWFAWDNALDVFDDLFVALADGLDDEAAHGVDDDNGCTGVNASRERDQISRSTTSSQVVPQVGSTAQCNFLFDRVKARLVRDGRAQKEIQVVLVGAKLEVGLNSMVLGLAHSSLHSPRDRGAVGSDLLNVYGGSDNLDVIQRELRTLGKDLAIAEDKGTAIKVETVSIATLLVGVEVDSAALPGGLGNELEAHIEFLQAKVRAAGVGDYFNSVEAHVGMGGVGHKHLLACLGAETGVGGANDAVSKWDVGLALEDLQHLRQMILLPLGRSHPRGEETHFAVVAVIGQEHLGADEHNLSVQADDSAVVVDISVLDRKANVKQDVVTRSIREDLDEHLKRVQIGVLFTEVVLAAVAADFQLLLVRLATRYLLAMTKGTRLTGPTRSLAPAALAFWMDSMIL